MELFGEDRDRFMIARGIASAAAGYYRTAREGFERDSTHLPLMTLKWAESDYTMYETGFNYVKGQVLTIQMLQADSFRQMKELLSKARSA